MYIYHLKLSNKQGIVDFSIVTFNSYGNVINQLKFIQSNMYDFCNWLFMPRILDLTYMRYG